MNHLSRVLLLTRAFLVTLVFAVSGRAGAEEISETAGVDIAVGAFSGALYYVPDSDGYRVVATLSSGVHDLPLRLVAKLTQGQSVVFSVPGKIGEPEQRLEVVRKGDRLFVEISQ